MALQAEIRSGRGFVFVSTLLLGGRQYGWADAARRQSRMPIRDTLNAPYEAPRFTLRNDCLNPGLVRRSAKPFNVQYREQD
jgi:hypothetical protein